jgi:hypothetical protein
MKTLSAPLSRPRLQRALAFRQRRPDLVQHRSGHPLGLMAERMEASMQDDCGLVERDERKRIDEAIRLVAAFMRVGDGKARAEIIKLAEQCAAFDPGESIVRFGG